MNIHLHIERLVLDGLPVSYNQGAAVQAAVEAELTRLLMENGIAGHLETGGAMPYLSANPIQLSPGGNFLQLGTQVAQTVYSGIGNKE